MKLTAHVLRTHKKKTKTKKHTFHNNTVLQPMAISIACLNEGICLPSKVETRQKLKQLPVTQLPDVLYSNQFVELCRSFHIKEKKN